MFPPLKMAIHKPGNNTNKSGLGNCLWTVAKEWLPIRMTPRCSSWAVKAHCGKKIMTRVRHFTTQRSSDTYHSNGNENHDKLKKIKGASGYFLLQDTFCTTHPKRSRGQHSPLPNISRNQVCKRAQWVLSEVETCSVASVSRCFSNLPNGGLPGTPISAPASSGFCQTHTTLLIL